MGHVQASRGLGDNWPAPPPQTPGGTLPSLGGHLPLLTCSRPRTVSLPRMFSASQTYSPASSTFTLLNCSREFFLVREGTRGGEARVRATWIPSSHPAVTQHHLFMQSHKGCSGWEADSGSRWGAEPWSWRETWALRTHSRASSYTYVLNL